MIDIHDYSNRIIVCIPNTWPALYSKCVESLIPLFSWRNVNDLMENWDTVLMEINWGKWFPIDANRDEVVEFSLRKRYCPDCGYEENTCTHILFLDADSVFPEDIIQKLVAMDVAIAAGLQFHKKLPYAPIPLIADPGQGERPYIYHAANIQDKISPVECDAVGMGATLIKRELFERIPRPWFEYQMSRVAPRRDVSEDMAFCQKARALGYKIWVDPTAIVGHLAVESVGYQHYLAGQNILRERADKWEKISDVLTIGGLK